MDEKDLLDLSNFQTQWYIDVLYYLDRVLDSDLHTELGVRMIVTENGGIYRSRSENELLVELLKVCTQKMFMDHNPEAFMEWVNKYQLWKTIDMEIPYQLNEAVRVALHNLDWSDGIEYLTHYFEYCLIKEKYSGIVDKWGVVLKASTLLLECITPEFYGILCDHVASILEVFQQRLLLPRGSNQQYRREHAVEVSALVALLVDSRAFLENPFLPERDVMNDSYDAYFHIRQYQRDLEMLNDPRPQVRRSNLKKIRDRYNAESL
jgi:hypothetical protein